MAYEIEPSATSGQNTTVTFRRANRTGGVEAVIRVRQLRVNTGSWPLGATPGQEPPVEHLIGFLVSGHSLVGLLLARQLT